MPLTYGNLKQHVLLALGGQPSIVTGVTRDQRLAEIVNQAGQYLFSKQWRFRERTSRPLSVVSGQNWVSLPSDVDEIVTLTSKAGLGWVVEMTTPEHLEILRTAIEPGLMAGTFYAALSRPWAQSGGTTPLTPGTGLPEIRLELYPTPSASSSDTLIVRYRSAWPSLTDSTIDSYIIPVPPYCEALLVAYARAFAMAYEDEGLSARLIEVDGGPVYNNASIKDGLHQRDYGRLPTQRVGPFRRGSGSVSSGYGAVGALLAPATAFSNIRWRGVWIGSSTYAIGDVVRHGTNVYIAVIGSTNSTPPSSSWELMVQDGAVGPTGISGTNGQGVPAGGSSGQVLAKATSSDYDTTWTTPAPTGAEYLVRIADSALSAERVVTDSTSVTANWGTSGQVSLERAALTGDVTASANSNATTIANDAVTTAKIANDAVTFSKFQNVKDARIIGRESGVGTGDAKEIRLDSQFVWTTISGEPALTISVPSDATKVDTTTQVNAGTGLTGGGDLSTNRTISVASNGITTSLIADANVTLAKLQNITSERLLGRDSPMTGAVEEIAVTGGIEFSDAGSIQIADGGITFAKLQAVSANVLLGNDATGTTVQEITCTAAGRAILDDANASAQRTTLGLAAGGAGDIWVEKAGDFAPATSTITSGFGTGWAWQYTATPASTSTAQLTCFDFAIVNDAPSGVNTGNFLTFSAIGMYPGANANGNVTNVRGAQLFGTVARTTSAATLGTITNTLGLFATAATRFSGTSTATLTNAIGVDIQPVGNAAYTITYLAGLRVQTGGSGNTVTNAIGVDINAQTLGSSMNVGLRVAAPSGGSTTAAIQLSGTTGAASGLLFATDVNLYRSAANVLKTDDTFEALNVSGTNTGDQLTYASFTPVDNAPPAANAATSGLRNRIPVLEFDADTNETAYFIGIMPQGAKLASGLKVRIHWTAATATSGNCYWAVAFERLNTDIDADSFGADTLSAATTNGTSGVPNVTEITVTTIDGITAGDAFRLRILRQASDALDTMTGDAQIIAVEIRSAV